nr:reverse transcriptase domain-containing protein [Tanacetum cinerariifolium]
MRARSSSNIPVESPPNPSTSNPKCRNHRRSKQPFILEESPVDTMADQRTMAELLRAPTEGYAEAIVVPPILAEQFELKNSLINMMTSDQFFGLEKDNPHDHIRWFNKITSTIKYKDVPNSAIKLMLFPFSLVGAARRWLEKEPPRSILTWEDLVSKFINEFFPPSRTTNLRNKISNFQQRFDESFHEAWDTYKDLLHACPHHGFTELHQLDTFYNALNPADQYSFNSAAGGNLLERCTQEVLTIIENKSKFFAAGSNTFPELRDNIQGYVAAAAFNYNQGLPELISTRMTLELANRAICTPTGIARDVFVSIGKFTFPADFVIVDYESDPRVPFILGRPFLRTARALIDVHREEMILRDGDERLTLNMRHDTSSYSNQPKKESINLINVFMIQYHFFFFFSNHLLEEFADELALITFTLRNDDLTFDIESNLKKMEYLLHHDPIKDIDSILKDLIDQSNLADLNDNLVDFMPEMFTEEHALDYSSPPLYDEYDDDLFEVESDTEYVYDDSFDSKGEKIKESKLLID